MDRDEDEFDPASITPFTALIDNGINREFKVRLNDRGYAYVELGYSGDAYTETFVSAAVDPRTMEELLQALTAAYGQMDMNVDHSKEDWS